MTRTLITAILIGIFSICNCLAQRQKHSSYYEQRASLFEILPTSSKDIIFLGNSITNGGEWSELLKNCNIKNRGISGDTYNGIYDRLPTILKGTPSKIFLMIGVNDLAAKKTLEEISNGISKIIDKILQDSPNTEIYLQSLLPMTDIYNKFNEHTIYADKVKPLNLILKNISQEKKITYIDLYSVFVGTDGKMKSEYTNDGLHLLGKGYQKWVSVIKKYIK